MTLSKLTEAERRDAILEALNSLPPRYALIYSKRMDLYDGFPWTLEAIGNEEGCSRQRIHVLVQKANDLYKSSFEKVIIDRGIEQ